MKNKEKGFTLIELLAVIIILGVLMLIAVPSVTEYLSNSKRKAYLATANQYISGARLKVSELSYMFSNTDTLYYIPINCISLEKGGSSPFGEWSEAYVVVSFNNSSYDYYWTSYDSANMGMAITKEEDLGIDKVQSSINQIDKNSIIDGKTRIGEINSNTCNWIPTISEIEIEPTGDLLATMVSVGDFVNYDAGNWPETVAKPNSSKPFTFGGYTSGTNRSKSVTCYNGLANDYDGWRVLSTDGNVVKLVHAGTPECYFHPNTSLGVDLGYNSSYILIGSSAGAVNSAFPSAPHDWSYYVNSNYADSAVMLTRSMIDSWYGSNTDLVSITDDLINTGSYYWVGANWNSSFGVCMTDSGTKYSLFGIATGIRPVITLKPEVRTTGKNENNVWQLVE